MFQQEADSRNKKKRRAIGGSYEGSIWRIGVGYEKARKNNGLNLQH